LADEEIEVAIVVRIGEGRVGQETDIFDPEGIRAGCGEDRGRRTRLGDIPEKNRIAVIVPDKQVEVAIVVRIGEGRVGPAANPLDPEGIRAG